MTNRARLSRRTLISGAGSGAFAVVLGLPVPFARNLPNGLLPVALAQNNELDGKSGLTILSERPINAETPPHLLDEAVTSAKHMFVRNNGLVPRVDESALRNWRLEIDGDVETPLSLSLDALKQEFEAVTLQLQIECGGNGRKFMMPAAKGNQWSFGAISCAQWRGVRLADILKRASIKEKAVYTAHYGADRHLTGNPEKVAISRGIPIEKALEPHTIVAYEMNGEEIPLLNGFPLRLVAPGWPGSCSQKWLTRITLRDREHDGAKMGGQSYRVPSYPVAPGELVPDEAMKIIESMPVRSVITAPSTGATVGAGEVFEVRGHAWAGDNEVAALDISIDFGSTWQPAVLEKPVNRFAWQHWRTKFAIKEPGYYEVWARATDNLGRAQPPMQPGWNPRGYLNNLIHRIAVFAL